MKLENKLLAKFLQLYRAGSDPATHVALKHADPLTSGIPDVSITELGATTWLEFKAGAKIKWANELQWITCRRLENAGRCRIIFYEEPKDGPLWATPRGRWTHIIEPSDVDKAGRFTRSITAPGFNHRFVIDFVRSPLNIGRSGSPLAARSSHDPR